MRIESEKLANFIIGGTEKAGTTSVFVNLGQHPEVFGTTIKETNYFCYQFSDDQPSDTQAYGSFFRRAPTTCKVLMEASPGYLGDASNVAPRVRSLVPKTKLLFILRDPVGRLYSSYNFHVGKLNIPASVSFEEYVRLCIAYDSGKITATKAGLDAWFLKALRYGCYAEFLETFYQEFPAEQIKVMFFESLKTDATGFMTELSAFLDINTSFWNDYEFHKANVTFSSRIKFLHRLAIWANKLTEPLLRQRPALKQRIVKVYKKFNQSREGYDPIPNSVRNTLIDYYRPSIDALETLVVHPLPETWARVVTMPS